MSSEVLPNWPCFFVRMTPFCPPAFTFDETPTAVGQTAGIGYYHACPLGKTSSPLSASFPSAATITVPRPVAQPPGYQLSDMHVCMLRGCMLLGTDSHWVAKLNMSIHLHPIPAFLPPSTVWLDRARRVFGPQHPCGVLELNFNFQKCSGGLWLTNFRHLPMGNSSYERNPLRYLP
ncbi:hypothetical protein EI94DRAFT_1713383 [Lactarius quietus]|nr:hypothetical protein EI94DRAFT_1713383 [Lactarius quietus]